jgi:alkylation response protein AidB-like acyl-CoA dehydrogenase
MSTLAAGRSDRPGLAPLTPGSPALAEFIERVRREAAAAKRAGRPLHGIIDQVREARFGAFRLPRPDGGGASLRQFFATLIDLAHADPDVAHILRAHFWFVEERLRAPPGPERGRWLERVGGGDLVGNAMSEVGGSAPVGSWQFATTLTPEAGGYRLDGEKYYCTGSLYCDWVNVFGVLPDGELASATIPVTREGVTLADDWDGIGQKLTGSGSGRFERVHVAADELLRSAVDSAEAAQALRPDPYLIGQFCQLYLTAVSAGILRSVVDDATALLRARTRTYSHAAGATAAADPQLLAIVGELSAAAFAAEAAVLVAAEAQDEANGRGLAADTVFERAHRASLLAARAKVVVDELAQRAAARLFDVGGSAAVKAEFEYDRHWRNVRTLSSHNPAIYKARALGEHLVNGSLLPNSGFF